MSNNSKDDLSGSGLEEDYLEDDNDEIDSIDN